jgi:oxalate decarboxylase/phosphoglucose isomerase-like protein (cupin superfamily)
MDFDISRTLGIEGAVFDLVASVIHTSNDNVVGESWEKFLEDGNAQSKGIWRSLRVGMGNGDSKSKVPDLSKFWAKGRAIYSGKRRYYDDASVLASLDGMRVRPDVTILPSGMVDWELVRTQGHIHGRALPEIYSVVHGKAGFLLFEFGKDVREVRNPRLIVANPGEHVLFGPRDAHITVNLGLTPLVVTDLVSSDADPKFDAIEKMNGGPYWMIFNGADEIPKFVVNPKYETPPALRVLRPSKELVLPNGSSEGYKLRSGEALFNVPRTREGLEALHLLNEPWQQNYSKLYENAYVPLRGRL